jgi:hypothetical protein
MRSGVIDKSNPSEHFLRVRQTNFRPTALAFGFHYLMLDDRAVQKRVQVPQK